MIVDYALSLDSLRGLLARFFVLSGEKISTLAREWDAAEGAPVFTRNGKYTARGWTEWTQGFLYGAQILQFDAVGDEELLQWGRENTFRLMAPHVSHTGVHDHGFNNVSTYGNLRRLALEERTDETPDALAFYELALKVSGAVQAARWTAIPDGGFIHSFNGPHSLFSDTIRSCRVLVLADLLGHCLMGEGDRRISLRERAVQHLATTLLYNVYFGEGRDLYDVRGRVVHESIFNVADGAYRCPSTQQGYSPFSTWTRGLAWVVLGCAEQLEFFKAHPGNEDAGFLCQLIAGARATADFFIENTAADGIPYWDTGAPGMIYLEDYRERPAEPDNPFEPVDSSAAVIAAQGLLRLGRYLGNDEGRRYWQAGLTVAKTLVSAPYLSEDPGHHGLILHSVYHRPRGWDYIPDDKQVPFGESSMWGDYHAMELAVYLQRVLDDGPYLSFFGPE